MPTVAVFHITPNSPIFHFNACPHQSDESDVIHSLRQVMTVSFYS